MYVCAFFFCSFPPIVIRISAQIYVEPATDNELMREVSKARQTGFLIQCVTENLVCNTVACGLAFARTSYGKTTSWSFDSRFHKISYSNGHSALESDAIIL